MKPRTRKEIREEAIELLSQNDYILSHLIRDLRTNTKRTIKLLEELDHEGILKKWHAPSFYSGHLCMHYRIETQGR